MNLEENELFSNFSHDILLNDLKTIESDSLGKGSALSSNHHITFFNLEARRNVDWDISVSFLESIVLLDVVEVVTSDDNGSFHLMRDNHASKIRSGRLNDSSSNGDSAGERTLLINIASGDGFLRSFESKSDFLPAESNFVN